MKKAEQLVCGPVAQLFSFVGIDVAHHQRHVILSEVVEAGFLRQYTADHFMSDYKMSRPNVQKGGADKILDQNKINNRRRSRICIPTKKGLKP